MHRENGKPVPDAVLEILVALDHLAWSGSRARASLRPRNVFPGLLAINHAAEVRYEPLGVIGVIGPWNYPVLTPMGSLCYALAAGNSVVYKPSEYTPGIGAWLVEARGSAVPDHVEALQFITGLSNAGQTCLGIERVYVVGAAYDPFVEQAPSMRVAWS